MLKKGLCTLLAATMILAQSVPAFAENVTENVLPAEEAVTALDGDEAALNVDDVYAPNENGYIYYDAKAKKVGGRVADDSSFAGKEITIEFAGGVYDFESCEFKEYDFGTLEVSVDETTLCFQGDISKPFEELMDEKLGAPNAEGINLDITAIGHLDEEESQLGSMHFYRHKQGSKILTNISCGECGCSDVEIFTLSENGSDHPYTFGLGTEAKLSDAFLHIYEITSGKEILSQKINLTKSGSMYEYKVDNTLMSKISADKLYLFCVTNGEDRSTLQATYFGKMKASSSGSCHPTALSKATFAWNEGTPDLIYNGEAQVPEFTLSYEDEELERDAVYTVKYTLGKKTYQPEEIINAGTYKITISAVSNSGFSGSVSKTFTIKPVDLKDTGSKALNSAFIFTPADVFYYNPKGTVIVGTLAHEDLGELVLGKDFSMKVGGNKAAGTGDITKPKSQLITVVGKGNYKGTALIPYTIEPMDLANVQFADMNDVVNIPTNKPAAKLKSKVVAVNGKTKLAQGRDYTLTYLVEGEPLDISKAHDYPDGTVVTIAVEAGTGGNYIGSEVLSYKICKALLNKAIVTLDSSVTLENVESVDPADVLTVKLSKKGEALESEYWDTVGDNFTLTTVKGKTYASITVYGCEEYGGKIVKKFQVK